MVGMECGLYSDEGYMTTVDLNIVFPLLNILRKIGAINIEEVVSLKVSLFSQKEEYGDNRYRRLCDCE